jgi:hypothetical protein
VVFALQRDGLGADALAKMRAHATIAEYVDMRALEVFEVLPQAHKIEQATAGFHLNEQVYIA